MPTLVYQATVETVNKSETYIGLSAPPFKLRFEGHKGSFKHQERKKETTLSKYIWELKDESIPFTLSWKIMARAQPFSQVTGICQLCTREKYFICFKPGLCNLNSRNELLGSCRHKITNLLTKTSKKTNPGG